MKDASILSIYSFCCGFIAAVAVVAVLTGHLLPGAVFIGACVALSSAAGRIERDLCGDGGAGD